MRSCGLPTSHSGIPNLWALQTLDATKKADALERTLADEGKDRKLRVYLQVNTSGEDSKSGLAPLLEEGSTSDLVGLAQHIRSSCPHLQLQGVMTIGSWDASHDHGVENPDFVRLRETRDRLAQVLKLPPSELDLSMGMSADFEAAILAGSNTVRVGSRAFGQRGSKQDAAERRHQEVSTA